MSGERRKVRVGTVIQDRMDKTVVVAVEWRRAHNLYRKPVRRRSRFYAHDEANQCRIGDEVRIIETRPLSKLKRWRVVEVLSSTDIAEVAPEEIDREIIEGTDASQGAGEESGEAPVQAAIVVDEEAAPVEAAEEAEQEPAATDAPAAQADTDEGEDVPAPEAPVAEAEPEEAAAGDAEVSEEAVATETEAEGEGETEEKKETSE